MRSFTLVLLVFSCLPYLWGKWRKQVIHQGIEGKGIPNVIVASDWDEDGKIDTMSSFDGGVTVFRGPDWETSHQVTRFSEVYQGERKIKPSCIHGCLMDVDGDGDQDFIGSNQLVFWLECPDRPFEQEWTFRVIDEQILGSHCLTTADIDLDGRIDLVANSGRTENTPFPNSIAWLKVPTDPKSGESWLRHVFADGDAPGGSHYMGVGDVNDDGLPDVACAAKGGEKFPDGEWFAWWEQPKDGSVPWKKHLLSDRQPGASNILPADFDGDGKMDYFATRGHGLGALWFKGPGFEPIEVDSTVVNPHSLALGDLDGDGDLDAATCGSQRTGKVVWYESDGRGKFHRQLIGENQGSYDLRLVDMDEDSDLDVLIAGHFNGNLVWYANPSKKAPLPFPGQSSVWQGYEMKEFSMDQRICRVVQPKIAAPGRPWVWRARFWGHEPQADRSMLDRGWHITYCDVANLFGSPEAVHRWNNFHRIMTEDHGLSERVALEGMSRGGLIVYNWAKGNPDCTLCIYADAPVLDFKSWPAGQGKGKGSRKTWETCLKAYGLTEKEAASFKGLPLYGLESLANARVPLLHVVGQADQVVPVSENTDRMEKAYRELGGSIQVIRKKDVGHHPHSLEDPEPIVSFFLQAWKTHTEAP